MNGENGENGKLMGNPNGKKVLVTGGAGFLGSHLCDRLLKEGASVVCLDNFMTGQEANIAHLKDNPAFSAVRHDVADGVDGVAAYISRTPHKPYTIEEIYNLACPASPVHYQKDPVRTLKTSVWGALNMLELARRAGAKVLQASTSEVYGDAILSPQPESYHGNVNPIGIRACYDEGKRAAETLFFDYRRMYGTRIKVVRIFNTYGPRMHPADGRVVSNFIMQALRGEDITIYGDGRQTRSFCYVDDLIEAICRMMQSREDLAGPVNIGNPGEFTIRELAEKVLSLTGSRSKLAFQPLPQDDPQQRKPDIGLAKAELGWEPRVPLDEGLKMTIAWFKEVL
ncbi:MAG: SDR family oxidoreductase [Spirochaetaceae bacterium]|jgi:UDP-glucuronate decarboxylase|nr:SDR family oxidoreductase [Spirochaetaceae bacterium]